jgi:hypothetical protein
MMKEETRKRLQQYFDRGSEHQISHRQKSKFDHFIEGAITLPKIPSSKT